MEYLLPNYLVSLTYMQIKCSAAAFIRAQCYDYGSMQSYELCKRYAPWCGVQPPFPSPIRLLALMRGTHPQGIPQANARRMHKRFKLAKPAAAEYRRKSYISPARGNQESQFVLKRPFLSRQELLSEAVISYFTCCYFMPQIFTLV